MAGISETASAEGGPSSYVLRLPALASLAGAYNSRPMRWLGVNMKTILVSLVFLSGLWASGIGILLYLLT
ncbi:hypothetical protein ACFFP0_06325 [Rhizobium puerariae]|uniref:Uncharacterized protein n=1 Tax=Rhizobium puerariae TaxID=1585791 RepID=A0ABV6AF04_9HYPH